MPWIPWWIEEGQTMVTDSTGTRQILDLTRIRADLAKVDRHLDGLPARLTSPHVFTALNAATALRAAQELLAEVERLRHP